MSELVQAILRFLRSLKIWVIVSPWEQAVRVRRGKLVTVLNAGLHVKIPILDVVYVQSTRLRFTSCDRQTLTTLDGKTVTCAAAIGYEIADLEKLYRTAHHAEDTIRQMTRGAIATYLSRTNAAQLELACCSMGVRGLIDLTLFGLTVKEIVVTDLAIVRTYRLIGDYGGAYVTGQPLDTESKDQAASK
jgi:hypothetical protein